MPKTVKIFCLVMALISALAYVLMWVGVLTPGELDNGDMPAFYYIIPVAYIAIGILVFVKKRWVLITLACINAFTILVFYAMYTNQSDVMLSAPGLITKIAQILMEAGLIYLIVKFKSNKAIPEA
jgi:hypothetical protein